MSELAEVRRRELVTVAAAGGTRAPVDPGQVVPSRGGRPRLPDPLVGRVGRGRGATPTFDLVAFGRALRERDFGYQHTCYALDADIRLLGPDHEPAPPRVVRGRQAVKAWLAGFGGCDLVVTHLVDGGDRVAFTQRWHLHADADLVATSTAELSDDRICTQHTLLAWDQPSPRARRLSWRGLA